MDRRQFVIGLTGTVALAGPAKFANAQGGNTIRIIFPYAAGGSGDATIRLIADKMQASLNQPVVVENRTGGAGRIGVSAVKNAPPDGLTLLYTPFAPLRSIRSSTKRSNTIRSPTCDRLHRFAPSISGSQSARACR